MSKATIRAEERDPEALFYQLNEKETLPVDYMNAVIALAGIIVEQERRIKRLTDRVNNIGLVIDRNGKTVFKKFQELETRIIDMGFPT
jgi:tartrate dehydratase beta subunit/fumarate hydratase class I family protein